MNKVIVSGSCKIRKKRDCARQSFLLKRKNGFCMLFICLILLFCGFPTFAEDALGEIFAPVQMGTMAEKTWYHGETQAKESVSIHVPEMTGEYMLTIKEVLDDGVMVNEGDIVVRFDDSGFLKDLEGVQNDLELAKADLEKTRFDLKNRLIDLDLDIQRRELELAKANVMVVENSVIISRIDLEKSKLVVKNAQLELDQAKKARQEFEQENRVGLGVKELQVKEALSKVAKQKEKIAKSVIKAPKAGIIFKPFVRLNNEMGRVEKNKVVSPGDKLLEIPNLNDFQGIIYINPSDNRFVQASDAVSLTLFAMPETPLKGFVFRKENYPMTRNERLGKNDSEGSLEENKVFIEITDHDPVLRPGMSFKAEITSVIATGCLFVPRVGIQSDEASATFVTVKTPSGGQEKRLVKMGRAGISYVEILSGLAKGEAVVLSWPDTEVTER